MTGLLVALLSASVSAPLTPAAVRRVGRNHEDQVQECYDTWTSQLSDPPTERRLSLRLRVRPSGRPEAITAETFAGTPFASCVVSGVRRWRFPRHDGPGGTTTTLEFDVTPALSPRSPERAPNAQVESRGLSQEAILWVVAAHAGEVQTCFEEWLRALERSPGEQLMTLRLRVGLDGRVRRVEPDILAGTPMAACVVARVGAWRFPSHGGPEPAAMVLPFRLVPRRPEAAAQDAPSRQSPLPPRPLRPPRGVPPLGATPSSAQTP